MKTKKSAAPAALTPNGKSTTTSAPIASVAPAPKPAPAPASKSTTTASSSSVTTIEIKTDVGFGNAVFLRGTGGGLNWDRGVALVCVDGKTWRWSGTSKDPITFKPLLNDEIWSAGSDLTVKPGQKLEVQPIFS
jgi:hypothetical protein